MSGIGIGNGIGIQQGALLSLLSDVLSMNVDGTEYYLTQNIDGVEYYISM